MIFESSDVVFIETCVQIGGESATSVRCSFLEACSRKIASIVSGASTKIGLTKRQMIKIVRFPLRTRSYLSTDNLVRWSCCVGQVLQILTVDWKEINEHLLSVCSGILSENENLTFRGNTLATKSMDTYMKMVGHKVCLF